MLLIIYTAKPMLCHSPPCYPCLFEIVFVLFFINHWKYFFSGVTELALNWAFLAKIWVPDTFIVNGKKSFLHKITVPNRFVRISPNGRVSYSQASKLNSLPKGKLDGTLVCLKAIFSK